MASVYVKTITAAPGSEQLYNLGLREAFQRLTSIPTGWKRVRLGIIVSPTGKTGDNVVPTVESVYQQNIQHRLLFGLSNGVAFPGLPGSKFVGMSPAAATTMYLDTFTGGYWRISDNSAHTYNTWQLRPVHVNGPILTAGATNVQTYGQCLDPTALVDYCWGYLVELDVSTAGTLSIKLGGASDLSRANELDMVSLLTGAVTAAQTVTGGWWSGSDMDCKHLLFRAPFLQNTFRVHAVGYMQLA